MIDRPLVSIIVITYNSAKFVLETLESAKAQTYENIELIITDDGSKDETIQLCKDWLAENSVRFVRTEMITVEQNTGIPANCNRGVKAAQGEWVKLIAGDDILLENCVEDNLDFILKNNEIKAVQSKSDFYLNTFDKNNYTASAPTSSSIFFNKNNIEQSKLLLKKNEVIAPSTFLKRELLIKLGGFDEDFKLFEDITMWLKITRAGDRFYFLDKSTVGYRKHNETSEKASKPFMRKEYAKEILKFRRKYANNYVSFIERQKFTLRLNIIIILDKYGLNRNNIFCKNLYIIINKLFA